MAATNHTSMTPYPQTIQGKLLRRTSDVWQSHPDCKLCVGDVEPQMDVLKGKSVMVMIAKGPLMIMRYTKPSELRWIFDCFGS